MSYMLCGRIKAKKRKVEDKQKHGIVKGTEDGKSYLHHPEHRHEIQEHRLHQSKSPLHVCETEHSDLEYVLKQNGECAEYIDNFQDFVVMSESESRELLTVNDSTLTMDNHQQIVKALKLENEALRTELRQKMNSAQQANIQLEILQMKTEVESLRAQNAALQKGLQDFGLTAKVIEEREGKIREEEERLLSERETVQRQIEDCYDKMRPILEREAGRQQEMDDLRMKLSQQNRNSRRIFELMERLMVEWKQNVLLRAEVKKLKTIILSSSRSLNNLTRKMDDSEYQVRGSIKTEVSKMVKVTYDSKKEVIEHQKIILDALDAVLAVRRLKYQTHPTRSGNFDDELRPMLQKIKTDHKHVAKIIGQNWRKVGRGLGYDGNRLQQFDDLYGNNGVEEIAWNMLECWALDMEDESLLLGTFIEALRDADIDATIGPMPADDAAVFRRLQPYFNENLTHVGQILPYMFGFTMITMTVKEFIEEGRTDGEKVRRFLSMLPTLGEHTLPMMCEILPLSGHDFIAQEIRKTQLEVRLERDPNASQTMLSSESMYIQNHITIEMTAERLDNGNGEGSSPVQEFSKEQTKRNKDLLLWLYEKGHRGSTAIQEKSGDITDCPPMSP